VKPGTNLPVLQQKLGGILRGYLAGRKDYQSEEGSKELAKVQVKLGPGGLGIEQYQSKVAASLHTLMGVAGVVLLIACANIANLLIARGMTRRTENAVRMALGAAQSRLVRQSLTESLVLSFAGAVLGIGFAFAGTRMILALAFPAARHLPISATPSLPVLGFTLVLAVATGLLFGAAPAWTASHGQPADALRGAGRGSQDASSLPRRALIILQVTLSLVLLTMAGLLARSLGNALHQDFGLEVQDRMVIHLDPSAAGYGPERLDALMRALSERLLAVPGVQKIAFGNYSPLEGNAWGEAISIQGRPAPSIHTDTYTAWDRVSPGFFDVMGIRMLRGRGLSVNDRAGSPQVAVVNQSFVKKFFPATDPLGLDLSARHPAGDGRGRDEPRGCDSSCHRRGGPEPCDSGTGCDGGTDCGAA
jgi:macrolide transport system ATP-binding/permease protein